MMLDILLKNLSVENNWKIPQFLLISALLFEHLSKICKNDQKLPFVKLNTSQRI